MFAIPDEPKKISIDALNDIIEVGATFKLQVVKPLTEMGLPSQENMQDLYASIYGQNRVNDEPQINKDYELHAVATYDPTADQLKGSGLVESCRLRLMTVVYEFMQVGYADDCEVFHDFITKLKRNSLVEFNGRRYSIKEIAITGVYQGFGIVCNMGCDLYG